MPLEILHRALMLFRPRARLERAEIAPLARLRVHLCANRAGIRPISVCGSWQASLVTAYSTSELQAHVPAHQKHRLVTTLPRLSLIVIGHSQPFQRLLGVLIAERRGALVIGFRGVGVLWLRRAPLPRTRPSAPARRDDFAPPPFRTMRVPRRRPCRRRYLPTASCRAGIAPRRWSRPPSTSNSRARAGSAAEPAPPPSAARLVTPRGLPALAARSNSFRACASSLATPAPVP